MAKKISHPPPPLALLVPAMEPPGYDRPGDSRYTHMPNQDLANRRSSAADHVKLKEADLECGVSFCEPMAGQGFNDQFPFR